MHGLGHALAAYNLFNTHVTREVSQRRVEEGGYGNDSGGGDVEKEECLFLMYSMIGNFRDQWCYRVFD
uniref:Uncharacterized protein n=1 Tax=Tanacetum cinerariifolium TaxID=118510 RepID=A0A6L2KWL3_TANCI|nr:hypothetical protein [Tanacetum cinerariifolium]